MAREIEGKGWDPKAREERNEAMKEATFEGKHPTLQASLYLEHRARLAILKAAIDCIYYAEANKGKDTTLHDIFLSILPKTFLKGLEELEKHRYVKKYPLFWQILLCELGGFLLADRQKEEYEWLSTQTGIPVDEIPNALKAFDILFPLDGMSWHHKVKNTEAIIVRMMPVPIRGIGVYHRVRRWGIRTKGDLRKVYPGWTTDDLSRWIASLIGYVGPRPMLPAPAAPAPAKKP